MNSIFLVIILVPLIEIYLLIKIGSQIGAITTILLIFTTAIIGIYYAKYEGLNTLKSGFLQLSKNEIPTFKTMKIRLIKSLKRDKKILELITKLFPGRIKKKFIYNVEIDKKKYLDMIKNRYISILISLSGKQIYSGIQEINRKYKDTLKFKDKLICIIL